MHRRLSEPSLVIRSLLDRCMPSNLLKPTAHFATLEWRLPAVFAQLTSTVMIWCSEQVCRGCEGLLLKPRGLPALDACGAFRDGPLVLLHLQRCDDGLSVDPPSAGVAQVVALRPQGLQRVFQGLGNVQ